MNKFIFADLSSYAPAKSISFYENVFGWKFYEENNYYMAYYANKPIAGGLYETPDFFKKIKMPHFWMSYIRVKDIHDTVENAKLQGGIIELVEESNPIGSLALIRDPQGAGFTVYSGNKLNSRTDSDKHSLIWNELHVSNLEKILPFYQKLFDWEISMIGQDHYSIKTNSGEHQANISCIPNSIKGKYEYWVCTFGVKSIQDTEKLIIENSGAIISQESDRSMCCDNSGEAFFYIQKI